MSSLSVIIPTRNRNHTLSFLLKLLFSNSNNDFEVIVCDNSDSRSVSVDQYADDPRLRYYFSDAPISMKDNCEYAVSLAKGDFLCMLGDDDGLILDEAFKVIDYLRKYKLDYALSADATFYWPGLQRQIFGAREYGFEVGYQTVKTPVELDPKKELKKVLAGGGCKILGLPRLYQGIVSRAVIDNIRNSVGAVFNAPMPDMSSSVAIALFADRGVLLETPFVINGVSGNSGGGKGAAGKHSGLIKDAYGLSQQDKDRWPHQIPPVWTGGTVWAASLLITLESLGSDDYTDSINLNAINGYLIAFNPVLFLRHVGLGNVGLSGIYTALNYLVKRAGSLISNGYLYVKLFSGFGVRSMDIGSYINAKR